MTLTPPAQTLHSKQAGHCHDVKHSTAAMTKIQLPGVDVVDKLDEAITANKVEVDSDEALVVGGEAGAGVVTHDVHKLGAANTEYSTVTTHPCLISTNLKQSLSLHYCLASHSCVSLSLYMSLFHKSCETL